MTSSVLPPPVASPKKRRALPRLSEDPETRSIQIGVLGTLLVHLLLFLLAPLLFRGTTGGVVRKPKPRPFSIELAKDAFVKKPPTPTPNKFVETNPDAPDNIPDKTTNFAARNQQVAQEKPTPNGKNDAPAMDGKKDMAVTQIVTGKLEKPVDTPPDPPKVETPPSDHNVAAQRAEENPLSGVEKKEGTNPNGFGTNIAKYNENSKPIPNRIEGAKDVPIIQGQTAVQPSIDPQHPRARPTIVKQQQVRPAIFAENKFGTSNLGPIAIDAKWSNYGAYLQRMIETVQLEWDHILEESKVYPTPGSTVEVKFVMNSDGGITRIVNVESTATDFGSRACMSAITERAPYGKWTDDMIAILGTEQEMTFKFLYQ